MFERLLGPMTQEDAVLLAIAAAMALRGLYIYLVERKARRRLERIRARLDWWESVHGRWSTRGRMER